MKILHVLMGLLCTVSISLLAQDLKGIDEIAPFSEGMAAVRQGDQWGFINKEGTLVIKYRDDIYANKDADSSKSDISGVRYPLFHEGRCLITKKVQDGVPLYGYIDKEGNTVIEPQFLNVYPFENGYTTGVLFDKVFMGENEFKLKIYDFKFFDVLFDTSGKIDTYFERRENIQMTVRRYEIPAIGAKRLADDLVAVYLNDESWEIRRINQND